MDRYFLGAEKRNIFLNLLERGTPLKQNLDSGAQSSAVVSLHVPINCVQNGLQLILYFYVLYFE